MEKSKIIQLYNEKGEIEETLMSEEFCKKLTEYVKNELNKDKQ